MRAPQLAARRTQEFFFAFWGSMRVKVEGPMRGKMVKVSALEALFMMVKVGRRPETLPWDYVLNTRTTPLLKSQRVSSN